MEANWSFRPAIVPVAFDQARLPGSATAVAPTVLPVQKTVRPARESDDSGLDDRATEGEVSLDYNSYQVIYRVRDADTRRVIWQLPDAATRRLRAYTRAAGSKTDQAAAPQADIEV